MGVNLRCASDSNLICLGEDDVRRGFKKPNSRKLKPIALLSQDRKGIGTIQRYHPT